MEITAVVIEVVNRSGYVLSRHAVPSYPVTIGRAYDNNVVISDEYIDPHHATITLSEDDELIITDQQSLNGVVSKQASAAHSESGVLIHSGDAVVLGKTMIRVLRANTPVAPALPLSRWDNLSDSLSHWPLFFLVALSLSIFIIFDTYLSTPMLEDKFSAYTVVLYLFLGMAFYAGIFCFLGKIFRHDSRFTLYFTLAATTLLLITLSDSLFSLLSFNLGVSFSGDSSYTLWLALLFAVLIYFSLYFSCRIRFTYNVLLSSVVPVLVAVNLLLPLLDDDAVVFLPAYDTGLFNNTFYMGGYETPDVFVNSTDSLYRTDEVDKPESIDKAINAVVKDEN